MRPITAFSALAQPQSGGEEATTPGSADENPFLAQADSADTPPREPLSPESDRPPQPPPPDAADLFDDDFSVAASESETGVNLTLGDYEDRGES